jgi:serine/threonine protein kinase
MSSRNSVDKNVDIKADNILIEIEDQGILKAFVDAEMSSPSPRKVVDGKPIYETRQFGLPKEYGRVVLGDFGSAVRGDKPQIHDAQPDVYRCPEVMLKTEWGYPADIWNVGAMVRTFSSLRRNQTLTEVHRFGTSMRINTSFTASIQSKSDT